jgi:hypothetical protein
VSVALAKVGLVYNKTHHALICRNHKRIVPASGQTLSEMAQHLSDHFRRGHPEIYRMQGVIPSACLKLINPFIDLRSGDAVLSRINAIDDENGPEPVQGIETLDGYQCTRCGWCGPSVAMKKHLERRHQHVGSFTESTTIHTLQQISCDGSFVRVKSKSRSGFRNAAWQSVYRDVVGEGDCNPQIQSQASSPLAQHLGWIQFVGTSATDVQTLVNPPEDESIAQALRDQIVRYMKITNEAIPAQNITLRRSVGPSSE